MIDAVFISDLHLHPHEPDITERFHRFITWASVHTKKVYILGDFFHAWSGDDTLDDWSRGIALQLARLAEKGIELYFMPGNRDFLVGHQFLHLAALTLLREPTVIDLDGDKVLLVHGDRYCIKDKAHQWFRRLTRNPLFPSLFLRIPQRIRKRLVNAVRLHSQSHHQKPAPYMDVDVPTLLLHMAQHDVTKLIHGHTHKPGLTTHAYDGGEFQQYVLSDWDDNPLLMCYDKTNGFYFNRLSRG